MGFNRSGEHEKKSRRVLRGDFAQMLFGSRWITMYVLSLLVGLQWLLVVIYQVYPDLPLVTYSRWLFAGFFGYFAAIWLKAGGRALRGRSALGDGCFTDSRRNLFYAALPYFALYLAGDVLGPGDPRLWPVLGLICAAGLLLLPFLLLEKQSPVQAWRSARRVVERKPLLVASTLLATAGLYAASSRFVAFGYEYLLKLLTMALYQQIGGLTGEILRWPVTGVVAYLCQLVLATTCWMLPGPAALWIYWKGRR